MDLSGTQPFPIPASTGGTSGNDEISHTFTATPGSSVPQLIATPCHDAQPLNNSNDGNKPPSPAGDRSSETLHLRLLSVTVILLIVAGAVLIVVVCVRFFVQKKSRKRGFDRRNGSDMTGNPMYDTHTSTSANPFILSPFLEGSTAISRLSNTTSYENPDRLYENPDRYGEINRGMINTCGMPTLLNSAYTSSEDGDCGEKYNDYTIATPLNPAYSSLQREQSLDHSLAQQQEEPKATNSDESLLDIGVQRPRSAMIIAPINGEIMKTPSQLFEILHEEPEVSDTSTAIVKQENDGGKIVEEEREDAQQEEPEERYCIFIPQKDL